MNRRRLLLVLSVKSWGVVGIFMGRENQDFRSTPFDADRFLLSSLVICWK